jgi:long-chain acyl-CoA synthetase
MAMSFDLHDRVGVELPEDAIARVRTVRDLLREAMEAEETAGSMVDPAVQLTEPQRLLDPQQRRWLTERGPLLRGLGAALLALDRLLMRIVFPLEVQGLDHIPRDGPCILICNHVSLLDPPALIAALPPGFLHRSDWGGWTGIMFRNPVMRLISRATRVLPIDQSSRPLANLALGAAALRSGNNLIWFPEGNRSPDGRLQPFQPGIGLIVTAHPVPVIPVRIEGTFNALPRGARWPRRGQIRILFGKSLTPEELGGQRTGPDRYRHIAAALHDRVAALDGR